MNQFEGKTAVVSGGGEGIGLAIAKALGARSYLQTGSYSVSLCTV